VSHSEMPSCRASAPVRETALAQILGGSDDFPHSPAQDARGRHRDPSGVEPPHHRWGKIAPPELAGAHTESSLSQDPNFAVIWARRFGPSSIDAAA
jgi:hypothetical protein